VARSWWDVYYWNNSTKEISNVLKLIFNWSINKSAVNVCYITVFDYSESELELDEDEPEEPDEDEEDEEPLFL